MKKSTLFISAVLSAFMLAVLAGAVTAYRTLAGGTETTTQQSAPIVQVVDSAPAAITPEQAAQVAARFLGRTDLYSVETTSLNGDSVYLVTFSSGDLVYISPQGQVLSLVSAPARVQSSAPAVQQSAPSGGFGGEREHEGGDDD